MSVPGDEGGEATLTEEQVGTAVRLYLKYVHGVMFDRVREVRWPVYNGVGDKFCKVQVEPKRGSSPATD